MRGLVGVVDVGGSFCFVKIRDYSVNKGIYSWFKESDIESVKVLRKDDCMKNFDDFLQIIEEEKLMQKSLEQIIKDNKLPTFSQHDMELVQVIGQGFAIANREILRRYTEWIQTP